jgi:hypothetical protein
MTAAWEGIEHPIAATSVRFAPGEHVKYVPNHRSFGAFMRSDQMRDVTIEVAEDIAAMAKEFSPQSKRGGDQTGRRMRDQFKVERDAGLMKVGGNLRVLVIVSNNARSAAPNEFGTRRNKRYRMLGRAGAMFGDFKPEGGPS